MPAVLARLLALSGLDPLPRGRLLPALVVARFRSDVSQECARALRERNGGDMKDVRTTRRGLVVIALAAIAGAAHAKSKDEKLCADLADFRTSVTNLQQMGPQSTVGDLRQTESKLSATEKRITKEAKRDKHARDLHAAIQDLDRAVKQLSDNSTIASAQASIEDKVNAVSDAANAFSQTYCPAGQ